MHAAPGPAHPGRQMRCATSETDRGGSRSRPTVNSIEKNCQLLILFKNETVCVCIAISGPSSELINLIDCLETAKFRTFSPTYRKGLCLSFAYVIARRPESTQFLNFI